MPGIIIASLWKQVVCFSIAATELSEENISDTLLIQFRQRNGVCKRNFSNVAVHGNLLADHHNCDEKGESSKRVRNRVAASV